MEKVLLAGHFSGALQTVYDDIADAYRVQLCPTDYTTMSGMIRITKPAAIVLFQLSSGDFTKDVLLGLRSDFPQIPVLIICPQSDVSYFETFCKTEQFSLLLRPIKKSQVIERIEGLFGNLDITEVVEAEEDAVKKTVKPKILAIDDNPVILRSLKEVLSDEYNVYAASSGEKAIEMAQKIEVDLILLDYEMPDKNGVDVFRTLKKQIKTYKTPVVFLTAVADMERTKEVISEKPAGYLLKPIDNVVLKNTIKNILK